MGGIEKGWVFFFFSLQFSFNAITESMWKASCFMHLVRLKTNTGRTGCLQAACAWQLPGREGDAGEMSWNDLSPRSTYRIYFTRLNPLSITLAGATQKESKKDIAILHKDRAANPRFLNKKWAHTSHPSVESLLRNKYCHWTSIFGFCGKDCISLCKLRRKKLPRLAHFELLSNIFTGICRKGVRREYILLQDPFHLSLKIEVGIVSCRVFHYLIR